jgi:hypothetical protein
MIAVICILSGAISAELFTFKNPVLLMFSKLKGDGSGSYIYLLSVR